MIIRLNLENFDLNPNGGMMSPGGPDRMREVLTNLLERKFLANTLRLEAGLGKDISTATVSFTDPLEAALLLASFCEDKDRATQFKLFWGGA